MQKTALKAVLFSALGFLVATTARNKVSAIRRITE